MLAKARSDLIAKRAALSAPLFFLPRLLLCSGLPRTSLLTMIDRLGRLGDSSPERDEVFLRLLVPSASSEWDIGRVGHRRDVSRKLIGRLSAYLRMNKVPLGDDNAEVSMSFLKWLSEECMSNIEEPKALRQKKPKSVSAPVCLSTLKHASSFLSTFASEESLEEASTSKQDGENFDEKAFVTHGEGTEVPRIPGNVKGNAKPFIDLCLKDSHAQELGSWLETLYVKAQPKIGLRSEEDDVDFVDISVELLRSYQSLEFRHSWMTKIILKWVPLLTRDAGNRELWRLIFGKDDKPTCSTTEIDSLLTRCMASWSKSHILSCTDWIISVGERVPAECRCDRVANFLLLTSERSSIQIERFSASSYNSSWGCSEHFVSCATAVALECFGQSDDETKGRLSNRNVVPSCLSLLLLLADCGRKQLRCVSDSVMQQLPGEKDKARRHALEAALLRLYLCHPFWMDLSSAAVRTALLHASESHARCWNEWRSTMDDQLDDMIDGLRRGDVRLTRPLCEFSRKHPLLILRKCKGIIAVLKDDALRGSGSDGDIRGVVQGQSLSGPLEARMYGRNVHLRSRHWGYNYTEPLWVAFLDIMAAIPREVLFTSGRNIGLQDVLGIYLQLLLVQLQLCTADKAVRLKAKFSDFLSAFKQGNESGWIDWLGSEIEGSEVRNLLISCNLITPQEAIDSLKTN